MKTIWILEKISSNWMSSCHFVYLSCGSVFLHVLTWINRRRLPLRLWWLKPFMENWKCDICSNSFPYKWVLISSKIGEKVEMWRLWWLLSNFHGNLESKLTCDICGNSFRYNCVLRGHMIWFHGKLERKHSATSNSPYRKKNFFVFHF